LASMAAIAASLMCRGVCGEMRLAGAEIHQVGALRTQFGGLGSYGQRGGNLDPADAVGKDLRRSGDCHGSSYLYRFCGHA
jgi:hypothetical protein